MNENLKYVLSIVNDLQRFAEAKHAGLIVVNSGVIIGIITSYSSFHFFEKYSSIISIIILGLSILGSLLAQFPNTSKILVSEEEIQNPNLLYFEHLSKINSQKFVVEFSKSQTNFNPNELELNLINQILVNAKITSSKFMIFKFCIYTTSIGLGILGFSTLINILCH